MAYSPLIAYRGQDSSRAASPQKRRPSKATAPCISQYIGSDCLNLQSGCCCAVTAFGHRACAGIHAHGVMINDARQHACGRSPCAHAIWVPRMQSTPSNVDGAPAALRPFRFASATANFGGGLSVALAKATQHISAYCTSIAGERVGSSTFAPCVPSAGQHTGSTVWSTVSHTRASTIRASVAASAVAVADAYHRGPAIARRVYIQSGPTDRMIATAAIQTPSPVTRFRMPNGRSGGSRPRQRRASGR